MAATARPLECRVDPETIAAHLSASDLERPDKRPAPEIQRLRTEAFDGLVQVVERAHAAGVLRADFTTQDVVVVLMANAGLVERASGIATDASERLIHVLLDGFRATAATDGPVAPSERRTQVAMRRNAEHRLGTKRTPTTTPRTKERPS